MGPVADFTLAGRTIGVTAPPLVIAEMSGNHNHSLERALAIVDAAADVGAHAIKIQTYTADTLTLDVEQDEFVITASGSPWVGRSLHSLYAEAHTPWEWHEAIFTRAAARGLIAFSTPFDETAVDFLEKLDVPCYKIASFENVHIPLIRRVAATGKPIIMSTGMATADELSDAVEAARGAGCEDLVLLKCTSTYPATPENSNLATIADMRERFGCHVGLSDHSMGLGVAVAATALGAVVIEKHFTLARADGGVDSAFSMEPAEMAALAIETERAWQAMGTVFYGPTGPEKDSLQFRRSIYVAEDMREGDVFTTENLRVVRPGLGLPPKHLDELLGKHITRDAPKGTSVILGSDRLVGRTVVVAQARMSSTRLPGKTLMDLGGMPVVARVIERAARARLADEVVVATTTDPSDDILAEHLQSLGISFVRGSLDDVLSRYVLAAEASQQRPSSESPVIVRLSTPR